MKSSVYKEIENDVATGKATEETIKPIYKVLIRQSIIYLVEAIIICFASLFVVKKVNLLSIIPTGFYYTLAILFIIYMVLSILFSTCLKVLKPFGLIIYYKVFDILSFALILVLNLSALIIFVVTPTTVVGNSMNNTLYNGNRVLVAHLGYKAHDNDIVVLHVSEKYGKANALYIKRVVATSGDTVVYEEEYTRLIVNGAVVDENITLHEFKTMTKLKSEEEGTYTECVVPKGYSIVLGDHRSNSDDSRVFGLVSNSDILGKAIFRLTPFGRIPAKKISND